MAVGGGVQSIWNGKFLYHEASWPAETVLEFEQGTTYTGTPSGNFRRKVLQDLRMS